MSVSRGSCQTPNPRIWKRIGRTQKGDGIYRSLIGNYAVEKDHKYLVEPTEEEWGEIERLTVLLAPLQNRRVYRREFPRMNRNEK